MTSSGPAALVIGAGRIGRGFLGQLLSLDGWRITFVDAVPALVASLAAAGRYRVHILGDETKSSDVSGFAVCTLESEEFNVAWRDADLIFTCVGGQHLQAVGRRIAQALGQVGFGTTRTKNVIACENWNRPAAELARAVRDALPPTSDALLTRIGFADAAVMRVAVDPPSVIAPRQELDVWAHDYWELPLDGQALVGSPPPLTGLRPMPSFGRFLERKLYTNNTSNAVIAYNGYLAGYELTAEAAVAPDIVPLLDAAYQEINQMCVAEFGVEMEDQELLAAQARAKYSNPAIVDRLSRHARDPVRKLGPKDRLIAPARLCLRHGIQPDAIVVTIAAALRYDEPTDPAATKLQALVASEGVPRVLESVCQLRSDEPLFTLILKEIADGD